ncbi:integrase [Bradyrhizobium sp. USDA 3686]|nr:hypothetical protein [Bradyrhizobium canariense]MBM7486807.1 integrase [Bradyrhizobium canariense]
MEQGEDRRREAAAPSEALWSIRTKLQVESRVRDLALFNIAIDSKLRGGDVVALKVDDVAPGGYAADRATVRQEQTGRPVKFELTESTRDRRLSAGDRQKVRPAPIPDAFPSQERSDLDLPANRQPASHATPSEANQDREYCPVPGN